MSFAQVVYQVSSSPSFAAEFRSNPEATLTRHGILLSPEEIKAILQVLKNEALELRQLFATSWRT